MYAYDVRTLKLLYTHVSSDRILKASSRYITAGASNQFNSYLLSSEYTQRAICDFCKNRSKYINKTQKKTSGLQPLPIM